MMFELHEVEGIILSKKSATRVKTLRLMQY